MLQNPSKYHPNPLSHFLALHNSAASHHQHHSHQQHEQHSALGGPTLDASVTTSLDVGKSFTIAAILGLQKTAIESNQKDYNSVMNLSLNGHLQKNNCVTSNGNSGLSVNNFDCDSVNSGRYLPTNGVSPVNPAHLRINHFGHHAAVTAAAAVAANATAPSALQSLQQLHHHHTQQASLGFHARDKIKNDHNTTKKASLKSKRVRTIFTPEQLERLEAEFERQQYMVGPERLYLAHTLQLTEAQVKVWFQNRRIKWRKHHLELTQQRLALIRQTTQVQPVDNGISNPPNIGQINKFHQSESDLSICNDSMDTESVNESEDA